MSGGSDSFITKGSLLSGLGVNPKWIRDNPQYSVPIAAAAIGAATGGAGLAGLAGAGAAGAGAGAAEGATAAGLGDAAMGAGSIAAGDSALGAAGLGGDAAAGGMGLLANSLGTGAMDASGMAGTAIPGSTQSMFAQLKPYLDKAYKGLKTYQSIQQIGQAPGVQGQKITTAQMPQQQQPLPQQGQLSQMPGLMQHPIVAQGAQADIIRRLQQQGLLGGMQ